MCGRVWMWGVGIVCGGAPMLLAAQPVVRAVPVLRVDGVSSSGEPRLESVVAATRLADGTLIVADGKARTIKRFDARGKLVRTFGRKGSGPGEFSFLSWMGRCGVDTLIAIDDLSRRAAVFTTDGAFVREAKVTLRPVSCSTSGMIAGMTAPHVPRDGTPFAIARSRVEMLNTKGETLGASDSLDFIDMAWLEQAPMPRPMGRRIAVAPRRNDVVVASMDGSSLLFLSPKGVLLKTVRMGGESARPTKEQVERDIDDLLVNFPMGTGRTMMRDRLLGLPMPERQPAHFGVFDGGDGNIWLQVTPPGPAPTRLAVYGEHGRRPNDVELAARATVLEVARDHVVARVEDEDGTHSVVVFRVMRESRP